MEDTEQGIVVGGPVNKDGEKVLQGMEVNMSNFSDQTMTLAAIAVFVWGDTTITGVEHIRRQESNRIKGIVTELNRLGIACEEREDGVVIHSGKVRASREHPVEIQTYEDHRMAMAFALIGTREEGIVIDNPLCCRKTFENYFELLTKLNLRLE